MTAARALQRIAFIVVLTALAGCGSAAPTTPAPVATATASPTATPAPTPSPTPDAYKAFAAYAAAPSLVLQAELSGTMDVGVTTKVGGSFEVDGAGVRSTQTWTVGGKTVQSEQRIVTGAGYSKLGDGPWMKNPEWSGSKMPPRLAVALVDAGLTQKPGADGLHLTGQGAAIKDVAYALLLLDRSTTFQDGSVDLLVGMDGIPLTLTVKLSALSGTTKITTALVYTFEAKPVVAAISAPQNAWDARDPGHFYRLWTPPGWTEEIDSAPKDPNNIVDFYSDPNAAVAMYVNCQTGTWTLAEWTKDTNAFLTKRFGAKPDKAYDAKFGNTTAKVLEWANIKVDKYLTFVVNVSLVNGSVGCDLRWYNDPGTETADYATLNTIGSSFTFR